MFTLLSLTAAAHGLTAGHGAAQLDPTRARLVLAPSSATFPEADDDGDGLLSREELRTHRDALLDRVRDEVAVVDAELTLADVLPGVDHHSGDSGHFVKLVLTYTFDGPPEQVALRYELFDPELEQLALTVATSAQRGLVELTPLHPVTVLWEAS